MPNSLKCYRNSESTQNLILFLITSFPSTILVLPGKIIPCNKRKSSCARASSIRINGLPGGAFQESPNRLLHPSYFAAEPHQSLLCHFVLNTVFRHSGSLQMKSLVVCRDKYILLATDQSQLCKDLQSLNYYKQQQHFPHEGKSHPICCRESQ